MANMSYCKFRNTLRDLQDVYDSFDECSSEEEARARRRLYELCTRISEQFGEDDLEYTEEDEEESA